MQIAFQVQLKYSINTRVPQSFEDPQWLLQMYEKYMKSNTIDTGLQLNKIRWIAPWKAQASLSFWQNRWGSTFYPSMSSSHTLHTDSHGRIPTAGAELFPWIGKITPHFVRYIASLLTLCSTWCFTWGPQIICTPLSTLYLSTLHFKCSMQQPFYYIKQLSSCINVHLTLSFFSNCPSQMMHEVICSSTSPEADKLTDTWKWHRNQSHPAQHLAQLPPKQRRLLSRNDPKENSNYTAKRRPKGWLWLGQASKS